MLVGCEEVVEWEGGGEERGEGHQGHIGGCDGEIEIWEVPVKIVTMEAKMLVPSADVDLSAWGSRSVGLRVSMIFWYSVLICASDRKGRLYKLLIPVSMQHKSCEEVLIESKKSADNM